MLHLISVLLNLLRVAWGSDIWSVLKNISCVLVPSHRFRGYSSTLVSVLRGVGSPLSQFSFRHCPTVIELSVSPFNSVSFTACILGLCFQVHTRFIIAIYS